MDFGLPPQHHSATPHQTPSGPYPNQAQSAVTPPAPFEPTPSVITPPTMTQHTLPEADSTGDPRDDRPVPVVQVLSVRGVEYAIMTFLLWFLAGSLLWIVLGLVNDMADFSLLAMPVALLIVCLPIFSFFFIRLRRAEVANPALRFDPSKRRLSQFTQIIAFSACLFNIVGFVYLIMQKIGGESTPSLFKSFLNLVIVLVIAGGVFMYYWFDEHKLTKNR